MNLFYFLASLAVTVLFVAYLWNSGQSLPCAVWGVCTGISWCNWTSERIRLRAAAAERAEQSRHRFL